MPVVEERCREDGVEVACGGLPVVAFSVCRLGLKSLPAMCKSINVQINQFAFSKSVKNYILSQQYQTISTNQKSRLKIISYPILLAF